MVARREHERNRLRLALVWSLMMHGGIFLLPPIFSLRPSHAESHHELRVVMLKTFQANPLVPAPKRETAAKPLPLLPKPQLTTSIPFLVSEESPSFSITAFTPVEPPETVSGSTMPVVEESVPLPPGPVASPRLNADYLSNPAPEYPRESRMRKEEGRVLLSVHVTADGRSDEVTIHRSSGFSRLDLASLEAVRRWKFVPARQDDKDVAATVVIPINFTLQR
jgi:protein TonB